MAGIEADQGVGEDVAATPMHSDMEIGFGKARALKKTRYRFSGAGIQSFCMMKICR